MTRVDEFDHFYSSTARTTLKATYAVCGDRNVAFESTIDAYRRAWRDWPKIRNHAPDSWVRNEAWRLTALERSTHLLRRRQEEDADADLMAALAKMRADDRRLISLMTLGSADLEVACREVGIPVQQGAETVTTALVSLESTLGDTLDQIEERLHRLGAVVNSVVLPAASVIRHRAQLGRRRNTVALVAGAVLLVVFGAVGVVGEPVDAERQRIGQERPDLILQAQKMGTNELLTAAQVQGLDRSRTWRVLSTNDDARATTPYATCPPTRFADPDPIRAWVRTFEASNSTDRVAQSVEVTRNADRAQQARRRLEKWFGDCKLPRVQLTKSWTVRRPFADFRILQLVSREGETQVFTVGIGTTGMIVNTIVHKTDGDDGPDLRTFARLLDNAVDGVCRFGGGRCAGGLNTVESVPPPVSSAPAFLAVADLPPVKDVEAVWTAVPRKATKNPASTICDKADFKGSRRSARTYVMPSATEVPKSFGLTQTVGKFTDDDAADKFVKAVRRSIVQCPEKNLAAQLEGARELDIKGADEAFTWLISIEVTRQEQAFYRTALIRRGDIVTQVTLTTSEKYDLSRAEFAFVADRAGQRLVYYREPKKS